ncbi:MAG: hypothetical protein ACRDRK_22420 [Pseudonocardia sp.]
MPHRSSAAGSRTAVDEAAWLPRLALRAIRASRWRPEPTSRSIVHGSEEEL